MTDYLKEAEDRFRDGYNAPQELSAMRQLSGGLANLVAHLRSTAAPSAPTATFPALPIDAEDERFVDGLMSKRAQAGRPMPGGPSEPTRDVQPPADGTGEVSDEGLALGAALFHDRQEHGGLSPRSKAAFIRGFREGRSSASAELASLRRQLAESQAWVGELEAKVKAWEPTVRAHTKDLPDSLCGIPKELRPVQEGKGGNG